MGREQQTLLAQRAVDDPSSAIVRRIQAEWIRQEFRGCSPKYVLSFLLTMELDGGTDCWR